MKKILVIASMMASSMAFAASPASTVAATPASVASAASQPRVLTVQQQKMVDCNKQATGKKGTERKEFMSACLKKTPVSSTSVAPKAASATTPVSAPVAASSVAVKK
jgi:hypothetical protein